jgi:catechol 2,3-dioxygenase-like lactoylglutathione lyase family enzyme
MKKRTGEPWITAPDYGRLLPSFSVNLLVRDMARSIRFYREVLAAFVHYSDPDFAAIKLAGVEVMLHADHTYEDHPWYAQLASTDRRGLGAELRLLGMDPDAVESRARAADSRIVKAAATRGHGWREVMVEDPDGYVWAVGVLRDPA